MKIFNMTGTMIGVQNCDVTSLKIITHSQSLAKKSIFLFTIVSVQRQIWALQKKCDQCGTNLGDFPALSFVFVC